MQEKERSLIFFLLSHHRPEKLHRTIHICLCGKNIYLCARCTGISAGLISTLISGLNPPTLLYICLLATLPLPAAIDWITQTYGFRESKNIIRVGTGFLLGIGWGLFILSIIRGIINIILFAITILNLYIISIYLIARKTNLLKNYFN